MTTTAVQRQKRGTKRGTVERARRVSAHEAAHVGAAFVTVPIARSRAAKPYAKCPTCDRRALYLYACDDPATDWKCRHCARLVYQRSQEHATRAAFARWLTPERHAAMAAKHPAQHELYARMAELWRETCAPLDWPKLDAEQRAELLETFASAEAVMRAFDRARSRWSGETGELAQAAGEQIRADLWAWWKDKQRR